MAEKYLLYIFLLLILFCRCSSEFDGAENGDQLFMKFYGGAGEDEGNALIALDEGFAMIGSTTSFGKGDSDLFIVITDNNGNTRLNKAIGGTGNQYGSEIIKVDDKLLAVGHTEDSAGNADIWILEMNHQGDSLRSWTFGSPDIDEVGVDLQVVANGDLVVTATRYVTNNNPDTYLFRLNAQMEVVWENQNALNNLSDLFGKNIIENPEGEVVYCGTSKRSSTGNTDMRLTAINSIGEVEWNTYFGENGSIDEANAVIEHLGAFYLIGNSAASGESDSDILLIKTNRAGNSAQTFTLGVSGISETGKQLVSLSDGNLLLVGERKVKGDNFKDIYIEKIDNRGNTLWKEPYVLSGSLDDFATDALETADGDLVICGTVSYSGNPMMLLVKMNKDGKLIR